MNDEVQRLLFVFTGFILILEIGCAKKDDFPVLKGPYLGQKPPGNIPYYEYALGGAVLLQYSYE